MAIIDRIGVSRFLTAIMNGQCPYATSQVILVRIIDKDGGSGLGWVSGHAVLGWAPSLRRIPRASFCLGCGGCYQEAKGLDALFQEI